MKFTLLLLFLSFFSLNASAECEDNNNIEDIQIKKSVKDKAKKFGYHLIGVKINSKTYYGENLADSEYSKCMPMNGMNLIILRVSDFCDSDTSKIKVYVNKYNKSVNELLVEKSDCSLKKLIRS